VTAAAPVFSAEWGARDYWAPMFDDLGLTGKPGLRFLEVGCFEGRATLWLLDHILTDPTAHIVAVDTFEGSPEFVPMMIDGRSRARFDRNLAAPIAAGKVTVLEGDSKVTLRGLPLWKQFDFVYIDGSHRAPDVLTDAVLAWQLLKPGGVLAFDDYGWDLSAPETERPQAAIDAFLSIFAAELTVRHSDYQVAVEKCS
jgi:SAM-dependent methyltransferase